MTTVATINLLPKSSSGQNTAGTSNEVFPTVAGTLQMIQEHKAVSDSWINWGDAPTQVSSSSLSVPGDKTAFYSIGTRIRVTDIVTLYGTITNSSFGSGVTTVTVDLDSGSITTPTAVATGPDIDSLPSNEVPNATTTTKGIVEKATQTEAREGAANKYPDAAGIKDALANSSTTLAVGYPITPASYGNLTANPTIDFKKARGCTLINNGAGTIGAPTGNGEQVVIITNGATPATPDISAFNLVSGVFSDVADTGKTRMYIEKYEGSVANIWLEVLA